MDNELLPEYLNPSLQPKMLERVQGIGMAVVHGIVGRHDGVIIVDSHLGQGTTFTILLPAYEGLLKQEIDTQIICQPEKNAFCMLTTKHRSLILANAV